jgi:hypothetical protein
MTYVPRVPLWCWVLQGADVMFFSQPTEAIFVEPPLLAEDGRLRALGAMKRWFLGDRAACVARCQDLTYFVLDHDAFDRGEWDRAVAPPVQCGRVARLDPLGLFLCDDCYRKRWGWRWCGASLPAPSREREAIVRRRARPRPSGLRKAIQTQA